MSWPNVAVEIKGGWRFQSVLPPLDYTVLIRPDGRAFGPNDMLIVSEVAQLRGTTAGSIRCALLDRRIKGKKTGMGWLIYACDAITPHTPKDRKPTSAATKQKISAAMKRVKGENK